MEEMLSIEEMLEKFLDSPDFKQGVISATKASWSGNQYKLELLADSWQMFPAYQGTYYRYETPGRILTLPILDTENLEEYVEYGVGTEEEFFEEAFYAYEEELKQDLREKLQSF